MKRHPTHMKGPVNIITGARPLTPVTKPRETVRSPKVVSRPARTFGDADWAAVVDAILGTDGASPEAKEEAASLVEAWAAHYFELDRQERTLAVEVGFHVQLDPHTYVIGIVDRLSVAPDGSLIVNEWKTTKPESRWWTEAEWLSRITASIQLPTYVLALTHGKLVIKEGLRPFTITGSTETPKVRVRAITKSSPPAFWPRLNHKLYTYEADALLATTNAYLNAAAGIRELRKVKRHLGADGLRVGPIVRTEPWQAMGQWCRSYNRDCEFLHECRSYNFPHEAPPVWREHERDNERTLMARFGLTFGQVSHPQTVILSQSSYDTWATCAEKYRRTKLDPVSVLRHGGTAEQQLGSAVHAGLSKFYELYK